MRLGPGAFQDPARPTTAATQEARLDFFDVLNRVAPEVGGSLQEEVLPLFQEVGLDAFTDTYDGLMEMEEDEVVGSVQSAKRALVDWAAEFHLLAPWVLCAALRSMRLWDRDYCKGRFVEISMVLGGVPRLKLPGWNPTLMTWDRYLRRVNNQLREYRNAIEKKAKAAGLEPAKQKYEPLHFEWVVRFQVQGWSKAKIARKYLRDPSTVHEGIQSTAELIDLPLRQ
jgi:hypothetical protein